MATGTPNLHEAIDKAVDRAASLGENLTDLRQRVRSSSPEALNSERQKRDRRQFLESLYDEEREGRDAFERIIGGNELQDSNFLARGALVAKTVMRIVIRAGGGRILGYGTGSLIGDGVLLTNNHVLPNSDVARASYAEAYYERGIEGDDAVKLTFALEPDKLWFTSKPLDFTVVGIAKSDSSGSASLSSLGWLPLIGRTGKVVEGEWMTIVQHPKGERKQLCVRENQLLKCDNDVLWYSTDTLGGSSGSPVFNNDWLMVALHHSGVPEMKDGRWQTQDGRDYDPARDDESKIKWIANEGIRVSRILETLRSDNEAANKPLIAAMLKLVVADVQVRLPVIYPGEAQRAAAIASIAPKPSAPEAPRTMPRESDMTKRRVTVTLEIDEDGRVSVAGAGSAEADLLEAGGAPKPKKIEIDAPVQPEEDWAKGFDPEFLGPDFVVDLPKVVRVIDGSVAPLERNSVYGFKAPDSVTATQGVLKYNGISIVMNAERRLAIYSAANINGGVEFPGLSRKGDIWLFDDRIKREHQIGNTLYAKNQLDRGHLTRREDMEWGTDPVDATRRANGTCTWTNCAPQHALFNQDKHPDKAIRLWGGLEKYILEQTARHYQFRVQAFTGPVFDEKDPLYRGVKIPLDYWKVVVAVDSNGRLFATGYILSQRQVIDDKGLEAAVEQPFGAFQTYQRSIAEIESVSGLEFTAGGGSASLNAYDPLAAELRKKPWQRRRRRGGPNGVQESTASDSVMTAEGALESFEDLLLGDV